MNEIGKIKMEFEHRKWAEIYDARRGIEHFNERILPALQLLDKANIEFEINLMGAWYCIIQLKKKGAKLPEHIYFELAKHFQDFPELSVSSGVPKFTFNWRGRTEYGELSQLDIKLDSSSCQIVSVTRTNWVEAHEEETTTYELEGDCSGISI